MAISCEERLSNAMRQIVATRTMARSSMEGSNIASLPGDILRQILLEVGMYYVDHDDWTYGIRMDGDLRALKNVRLTCRILYNIATPLLFPVLHVSIDYRSVERFEKLCRNPLIADYVRGAFVIWQCTHANWRRIRQSLESKNCASWIGYMKICTATSTFALIQTHTSRNMTDYSTS